MSLVTISELVKGAEQLETSVLEDYIQKILQIRAKRISTNFEKQESALLKNINLGLTPEKQERKAMLWKKRIAETLLSEEHEELMAIINEAEVLNVQRVINIGQLAQLREITPIQLMEDLFSDIEKVGSVLTKDQQTEVEKRYQELKDGTSKEMSLTDFKLNRINNKKDLSSQS